MTIDGVLARLGWRAREDVRVEPLAGGITNLNYRVSVGTEAFVVRIPGRDSETLGIDRRREHACSALAHRAGVGPEVVAFLEPEAVLVTRFVPGRPLGVDDMRHPTMLDRVAAVLRRYHDGAAFPGVFSPFQTVREYLAVATTRGAALPAGFDRLLAQADRLEAALGAPVLRSCHNDLLLANFLDDGERLWIIDWEYAAMGDVFFDLGNFAVHHQLGDEDERRLLERYCGEATAGAVARLKLMRIISDLREAMWAVVQTTISTLEYDFAAYGGKHFTRYAGQLRDPRLPRWLEDAQAPGGDVVAG
jgi:thiamine kinase-like enzyme